MGLERLLLCHPALDRRPVEIDQRMVGAVSVELFQIPDPGRAVTAHARLEREVGLKVVGEHADESVPAHRPTPAGIGSTQARICSVSPLKYTFVESGLEWPRIAEIVGSGVPARSSFVAAW